jgi:hypothetical protein
MQFLRNYPEIRLVKSDKLDNESIESGNRNRHGPFIYWELDHPNDLGLMITYAHCRET